MCIRDRASAERLRVAATRIAALPEADVSAPIRATREKLLRQYHIGGRPAYGEPKATLSSKGISFSRAPVPFVIPGAEPYPAETPVRRLHVFARAVLTEPASLLPKQLDGQVRSSKGFVHARVEGDWKRDMRFVDAYVLEVNFENAETLTIGLDGIFRYNDREPCYAPQWEDMLKLRSQLMPRSRTNPSVNVYLDGFPVGRLAECRAGEAEVKLKLFESSKGAKLPTTREEVILEIDGRIEVPAGKHVLMLEHRDMIDGILERVRFNLPREKAEAQEAMAREAEAAKKKAAEDEKKAKAQAEPAAEAATGK